MLLYLIHFNNFTVLHFFMIFYILIYTFYYLNLNSNFCFFNFWILIKKLIKNEIEKIIEI